MARSYRAGDRFGRLVLHCKVSIQGSRNTKWSCRCDCGETVVVPTSHLGNGHTKSCGCLQAEARTTHGFAKTRMHKLWLQIRYRCNPKSSEVHPYHSGRGITLCQEWNDFSVFRTWALSSGYEDGLTIDRINNDKGYLPENCRWVPRQEQGRNVRRNLYLTSNGKRQLLSDWAREYGVTYNSVYPRFKKGLSFEGIFWHGGS